MLTAYMGDYVRTLIATQRADIVIAKKDFQGRDAVTTVRTRAKMAATALSRPWGNPKA